jgi:cytochrome c
MRAFVAIALTLAPAAATAQPAPRGQILFLQCRACHTLKAGEPHKVGPNLHRIFARAPLAAAPVFKYSAALTAAKPKWTPTMLDAWLQRPGTLYKGTTMAFAGMPKPEDRAQLIAWLKDATR